MEPSRRLALCFAFLLALTACGQSLPPSDSAPTPAPKGDTIARVGLCYNSLTVKPKQLEAMAKEACGTGFEARFHDEKYSLETCPLATPVRVTFQCFPAAR